MSEREEVPFVMDETTMPHFAVLREFEEPVAWVARHRMADEIVRLRSQLAAAKKVVDAAIRYIDGDVNDPWGYFEDDRYDDLWEAVTDEKDRRARAKETKR